MKRFFFNGELKDIFDRVEAGQRLSAEDGIRLFRSNEITTLGYLASIVRRRLNGRRVYYSNYMNLNPTNVCETGCYFCAFAKLPGQEGAYTLSLDEIREHVRRAVEECHVREIHIVGGLNDHVPVDYYFDLIRAIREVSEENSREIYIKAYTAVEIDYLARRTGGSYADVLVRLRECGLSGLPGGGAEIFAERVRQKICPQKIGAKEWFEVHRTAHRLGIRSNCSMLYGHVEGIEDRVDHLLRLRALQDETGGFQSFIPLAFHPKNTRLNADFSDGFTDLKIYAVSRLLLDNCLHLKAYWTTLGIKMAQVALSFGVDDLAGTGLNEKIIHDAGADTPQGISQEEIIRLIRQASFEPCEVVSSYTQIFS